MNQEKTARASSARAESSISEISAPGVPPSSRSSSWAAPWVASGCAHLGAGTKPDVGCGVERGPLHIGEHRCQHHARTARRCKAHAKKC